ncbi:unnamed protein product [Lepeophtheirus salmonis]|uniref:(salmon louse) hypothetical protein n=1 Tax=Lepeophtheirus salmonis TaxID=72036 RepID=A0A7R8CXT3_LEPSM|nr:unnamed protein product [Lepeophtheirus salmonis]CAF2962194.1 unnamed protein product [Lepeophtheirus salmonis]
MDQFVIGKRIELPNRRLTTNTNSNQDPKPQCETKHWELVDKPIEYYKRKQRELKLLAQVLNSSTTLNDKGQLASYLVAYLSPDMVHTIFDDKSAEKFRSIPLNNNTMSRRMSLVIQGS